MINISEILMSAPINTPLYSTLIGDCKLVKATKDSIVVKSPTKTIILNQFGQFDICGEVALFPSRQSWSWLNVSYGDLPIGTPVVVYKNGDWCCHKYEGKQASKGFLVIPFNKFDINDIEGSKKYAL